MAKNNDKDKGYILIHRTILDNKDIWDTGEPFSKRDAWIDLLLLTQHSQYHGLERGQCGTSLTWLMNRWKWSKKKVHRFLHHLEALGMVTVKGTAKGTTLTIVNYDKFQNVGNTKGNTKGNTQRHTQGNAQGTQTKNVYTSNGYTKNEDTKGQGPGGEYRPGYEYVEGVGWVET